MRLKLWAAMTVVMLADTAAAEGQLYRLARTDAPVTVNCGANRRPVVRYVTSGGIREQQVSCVSTARRVQDAREGVRHRSWKKTALVVGGATAAGAGTGALIGGKKGALIGAAVGAGAGTVYEVHKRHRHRHRRR